MKEIGILFSAPMVRALLGGSKTQTRRIVKLPHDNPLGAWEPTEIGGENGDRTSDGRTIPAQQGIWHTRTGDCLMCPYGGPSDRLYVREAHRTYQDYDAQSWGRMQARLSLGPANMAACCPVQYEADGSRRCWEDASAAPGRYRHARFMPRWASRITLEITGARVERLQDISEADTQAEGADCLITDKFTEAEKALLDLPLMEDGHPYRNGYALLWESINGLGSWGANSWVWVVEFRSLEHA
jgi:hypothetical protein